MAGTRATAQLVAQSFNVYKRGGAKRIHLFHGGNEQQRYALGLNHLLVAFQRARIFGEVLVGAELRRIHKDGNRGCRALRPRRTYQGQMSRVQRAHGGHKAQPLLVGPGGAAKRAHLVD